MIIAELRKLWAGISVLIRVETRVDASKPMIRPSTAAISSEGVSGGCGGSQEAGKQSPNTEEAGSRGWCQGPHYVPQSSVTWILGSRGWFRDSYFPQFSVMWILESKGWFRGLFPLHGSVP